MEQHGELRWWFLPEFLVTWSKTEYQNRFILNLVISIFLCVFIEATSEVISNNHGGGSGAAGDEATVVNW
ncbi:hypothetical protein CTI12_AA584040 [Artemisia annua]|uniref:Uncharacterized protein n=1 Tax=Artemisia annua TaxID=35608 RepID=A0A2U1KMZ1_ARTAN|nr:hypothetical protein CTI12_AA584040 [Artemisia annua]